jgi:hypothetical protein
MSDITTKTNKDGKHLYPTKLLSLNSPSTTAALPVCVSPKRGSEWWMGKGLF